MLSKNVKRMFKSRTGLGIIFIGPFLLLLLIQGAYQIGEQFELEVGMAQGGTEQQAFIEEALGRKGFLIVKYEDIEKCKDDIQWGRRDLCVEFEERDAMAFYIDTSKVSLETMLRAVIDQAIDEQADIARQRYAEELAEELQGAAADFEEVKGKVDSFSDQDPAAVLEGIAEGLETGSTDLEAAISDLQAVRTDTEELYGEIRRDLESFERRVNDADRSAREQRATIAGIEEYNQDCEGLLDPGLYEEYDPELITNESYDEVREELIEYGTCKCVDFYREELIEVEEDLDDVIQQLGETKDDIDAAQARNEEFYQSMITLIDEQLLRLHNNDDSVREDAASLRSKASQIRTQLADFNDVMEQVSGRTLGVSSQADEIKHDLSHPFVMDIRSVNKNYDLIIYLFPMLFFFILTFVSIVFSATFVHSEVKSNALQRNLLAPATVRLGTLAIFLSLLLLIAVQAILLLLLGKLAFGFPLSIAIFAKAMFLTLIVITVFVTLGILIGGLFKTRLVIMFLALGISIVSFLYSPVILPINVMTPLARALIKVNPFSFGADTLSRIILYDLPISVFSSAAIGFLVFAALFLIIVLGLSDHRFR